MKGTHPFSTLRDGLWDSVTAASLIDSEFFLTSGAPLLYAGAASLKPVKGPSSPRGQAMAGSRPSTTSGTLPDAELADPAGLDRLFAVAYDELRRLAATVSADDPGATLNPTALVNEAYLKLARSLRLTPASQLHFKRIVARAMRQVLVEAARRRRAMKRGGGQALVPLHEELAWSNGTAEEVVYLERALSELARRRPRQAQVVECRFFGGFDLAETAELLGVSPATVVRDWRLARAWLARELGDAVDL